MYRDSALGLCIDLSGPDGNAFALMGRATRLARDLGYDKDKILNKMQESDYNHLVKVFEETFPMVTLLNKPGETEEEDDEDF